MTEEDKNDRYNVGVVALRDVIYMVLLKNGELHKTKLIDLREALEKVPTTDRRKWDRNYHLNEMIGAYDNWMDELVYEGGKIRLKATVCVQTYQVNKMALRYSIECTQTVGAILSLPYTTHEVANTTWRKGIFGRKSVADYEVRREFREKFEGLERFGDDQHWFDAFGLARFGYHKDQQDPLPGMAR